MRSWTQRFYQPRLRFTLGAEDRSVGRGVVILKFEEPRSSEPLLGKTGLVRGSVWVEGATGRVVKAEARIATSSVSTTVTTFAHDERLGITVPREMRTTWTSAAFGLVTGVAKYENYRRFDIRTDESIVQTPRP